VVLVDLRRTRALAPLGEPATSDDFLTRIVSENEINIQTGWSTYACSGILVGMARLTHVIPMDTYIE
jgi:hypothetical protein